MSADQYAKSTDVHRALTGIFKPWCSENGFKKAASKRCAFAKQAIHTPPLMLAFEVQCNSFGNSAHGGLFTLNAGVGEFDLNSPSGLHWRILKHCSVEMAAAATSVEKQIVDSRPPLETQWRQWQPGLDNWCRYYCVDDVQQWGHFLVPFLPELFLRFLEEVSVAPNEFGF